MVGAGFYACELVQGVWSACKAGDMLKAAAAYRSLLKVCKLTRSTEYGTAADMQKAIADARITGLMVSTPARSAAAASGRAGESWSPLGPPRPPYNAMAMEYRAKLHDKLGEMQGIRWGQGGGTPQKEARLQGQDAEGARAGQPQQ